MKKILTFVMIISVALCSLFALIGCSQTYYNISTVEELYAMESNKCYQLTCDIDLQEREWYPLEVKGFNGNGYAIKNCYINKTTGAYDSGFFTKLTRLNDVVFENIQMNISFTDSEHTGKIGIAWETTWCDNIAGIVAGSIIEPAENIIVRNSQAIYNIGVNCNEWVKLGGIVGSGALSNCKIQESSIICNIFSDSCGVDIGGLTGHTYKDISNNEVENLQIKCISKTSVNCGGVVGNFDRTNGNISNCIAKNSAIQIETASTYTSLVGGIVGYCQKDSGMQNCASINNDIKTDASYGYNIGGIVGKTGGKVTDCLSDSNILEGITSSNEYKQYAGIGGLCGSSSATISKSVAQNNKIIGTNSTISNSMFAAGFIASATASIVNCAVYNNTVSGGNRDAFTSKNEDLLFNSYIAEIGQLTPNINKVSILPETLWIDIINVLSLDEELWSIESGYLNLKIAE